MNIFASLILYFLAVAATAKELPSYIPICHRNQKTINQCMKMATQMIQPYLAKGVKELNIPPLEPLEIPLLKIEQGTGAVNFKATLTKILVHGLSKYNFREFKVLFNKNGANLSGKIDLPNLKLNSLYTIQGKVLLLPIQGNGDFTANITNCMATFDNVGILVKKKGTDYLQTKESRLHLNIGDAKVHFGNLFNGDPVLSKTTNDFFNQNSKDILNEIKPAIEAVVSMLIDDILNKMFKSTAYDKLFPA